MNNVPAEIQPTAKAPAKRKLATARWMDAISLLLLMASCLWVIGAAFPSVVRMATGMSILEDSASPEPHHPSMVEDDKDTPGRAPGSNPHFLFGSSDSDSVDEPPGGKAPGLPGEDDEGSIGVLQIGIAQGHLTLMDRPDFRGSPRGEIQSGEPLIIAKEAGDWALVTRVNGQLSGWARKEDLTMLSNPRRK